MARSSSRTERSVWSQTRSSLTHLTASGSAPVAVGRLRVLELLAGLISGPEIFLVSLFLTGGVGGTYPEEVRFPEEAEVNIPRALPPPIDVPLLLTGALPVPEDLVPVRPPDLENFSNGSDLPAAPVPAPAPISTTLSPTCRPEWISLALALFTTSWRTNLL